MVTYDSECCDHGEYEEYNSEPYDDSKPRWMFSLRNREPLNPGGKSKPAWTSAIKANSPSLRTYSEGGSLRTNRMRPRSKSTKRMSQSRSKSPGLFGSTYASRAKQREAIGTPLVRSRANSVCSTPPDSSRCIFLSNLVSLFQDVSLGQGPDLSHPEDSDANLHLQQEFRPIKDKGRDEIFQSLQGKKKMFPFR